MPIMSKFFYWFHFIRLNYYHLLAEDCLNDQLKGKFLKKADYHKTKAEQFNKFRKVIY